MANVDVVDVMDTNEAEMERKRYMRKKDIKKAGRP